MVAALDLTGKTYGKLAVVSRAPNRGTRTMWYCVCVCGNACEAQTAHLVRGARVSCGCTTAARKHGLINHELYPTWNMMMNRCYNSNHTYYARYGGRGITVQPSWHSCEVFITSILAILDRKPSPQHQLDRVDNNGNYTADNVRWASREENGRNRHDTKLVPFNGEWISIPEASIRSGIHYSTLQSRLRAGWDPESIFIPTRKSNNASNE